MKLSKFLDSLLPDKIKQQFVECMEDQDDLKVLWEHGHVFFNHFGRMENVPCEENLREAFYRGAAMFMEKDHEGCDIMIPVLLSESQRKKKMSCIAVQVKNRKKDVLGDKLRGDSQTDLKRGLGNLSTSIAHIGLMLSLKGQKGKEDADITYPPERQDKESRSGSKAPGKKYCFNDMNRVVAAIVGMDLDLYPGLIHPNDNRGAPGASSGVLEILKALLALRDEDDGANDEYKQQFRVFRS